MVGRFLVTTALEDSWPRAEPVLFLGEWCRRQSRKEKWSSIDAKVLPYHWDDRKKLYDDYLYLTDFYERLLENLTADLNRIHGERHESRYWRIILGPWLGSFVQILFDRWECIQRARQDFEIAGTVLIDGLSEPAVPNDMADFSSQQIGDEWNHAIYGLILRRLGIEGTSTAHAGRETPHAGNTPKTHLSAVRRVRRDVVRLYTRVASALSRDNDGFFLSTYLDGRDQLRLQLRLGQLPQMWKSPELARFDIVGSTRKWTVHGASSSEFERFVREIIPAQIPAAYLEGHKDIASHQETRAWPAHPRVIWTSNAYSSDEVFKTWAAGKVEQGAPLVIGQHGGHYGIGKWSFYEDHEIAISDRYFTWGWRETNRPNVVPVGQLKKKAVAPVDHSAQTGILVVTCALPRYSYWMYSVFVAGQYLQYFEDQCAFVSSLPERLQRHLVVRLFPLDFGWDQAARWQERMPEVAIDNGLLPIDDSIRQSRLCVCTYNATTFLESFSMDVPTVVFWNPEHWEVRESAVPFIDALKSVGIFHDRPESAAQQVEKIWDDVHGWWESPEVRNVLAYFKANYCDASGPLLDRLERALNDVISSSQRKQIH